MLQNDFQPGMSGDSGCIAALYLPCVAGILFFFFVTFCRHKKSPKKTRQKELTPPAGSAQTAFCLNGIVG